MSENTFVSIVEIDPQYYHGRVPERRELYQLAVDCGRMTEEEAKQRAIRDVVDDELFAQFEGLLTDLMKKFGDTKIEDVKFVLTAEIMPKAQQVANGIDVGIPGE